jgi:hypothetical protein
MKKRIRTMRFISGVVVTVLLPAGVVAQSLADVARKEEARRKAVKGEVKVYTNDNLVRSREGEAPPASATPTPAGPASSASGTAPANPNAAASKPATSDETKGEDYWKKRIKAAQESVARNKVLQAALEARVNALNTDFVNMDNPYQRNVIQENLKTAMTELERVKRDIVNGTKAIADIEEEARKANVPPGWLR